MVLDDCDGNVADYVQVNVVVQQIVDECVQIILVRAQVQINILLVMDLNQKQASLETAINSWINDNSSALTTYGEINDWDVFFDYKYVLFI